jgi:hypothetical protein
MNRFYSRDHEIFIDDHIRSMTSKRRGGDPTTARPVLAQRFDVIERM